MSIKKKALGFAHLLGLSATSAEDDDRKDDKDETAEEDERREGESDEDYEKRTGKKAKKAEDDDDEADAEGGDEKDPDAEEDEKDEKASAARGRERARCARIIAFGMKNGCAAQAGVLAFDTKLSAQAAIETLKASRLDGNTKPAGLRERMSGLPLPRIGADGGHGAPAPDSAEGKAAAIIAAGAKARGEKV